MNIRNNKSTLEKFDVSVNGFRDRHVLRKAKERYNSGKTIEKEKTKLSDNMFYDICYDFLNTIYRWRFYKSED